MAPTNIREGIDRLIKGLTDSDNPSPIRSFTPEQLTELREWFGELGLNLDYQSFSNNAKMSLEETQFRSRTTGRGPGIEAILGKEKIEALMEFCQEVSQGQKTHIVSRETGLPISDTQGRGCQQAIADLLAYVVARDERHLNNLNRRVWKYLLKVNKKNEARLAEINLLFDGYKPTTKETASVSGDSLWKAWIFLTDRE